MAAVLLEEAVDAGEAAMVGGGEDVLAALELELVVREKKPVPEFSGFVGTLTAAVGSADIGGMAKPTLDIAALTPTERLALIEELWDSLSPGDAVSATEAQRAELLGRVEALERGEMKVIPLEQALTAIRSGRARRTPQ